MKSQTSAGRVRQVPTLYLAAAGGLLLAAVVVSAATAAASKSGHRSQVASGRPSSSSRVDDNVALDTNEDHHLALASSTTSAQLVPVRRFETASKATSKTTGRSTDLSMGQSNIANAKVHVSPKDMATAAGHHYGGGHGHGKYYMYAESPKKGAYSFGYSRGNHKHMIMGKESGHKGHVHGYVKWHAKKGKGSHKYSYNHYDKKGKHHY